MMGIQVDVYMEGFYRRGDTVRFQNPAKIFGDGTPLELMVVLDGKCKNKKVAESRQYWAISRDGGYLYANGEARAAW